MLSATNTRLPHLEMRNAHVAERFAYDALAAAHMEPIVDLGNTSVGTFFYSAPIKLPKQLGLAGFKFKRIESDYVEFRRKTLARIADRFGWRPAQRPPGRTRAWLHELAFAPDRTHLHLPRRHGSGGFDPTLYTELATALDGQGHSEEAQLVRIAKVNDGNRARGLLSLIGGLPYRLFVGNGFRPARAIVWAILFIAIGTAVFQHAYDAHALIAVDPHKIHQPFQSIVYSADVLLPIVDLHQESRFEAAGAGSGYVRAYLWFQIVVGWLIATALGAAVGSSLRRS